MKKLIVVIPLMVMMVLLGGCGSGSSDGTIKGFEVPEVFGEQQISDSDMKELVKNNNPNELKNEINTVPDAINYFLTADFHFNDNEEDPIICIEKKCGNDFGVVATMNYLLGGDYDEIGTIYSEIEHEDGGFDFVNASYIKTGDKYYLVDPVEFTDLYNYKAEKSWLFRLPDSVIGESDNLDDIAASFEKDYGEATVTKADVSSYEEHVSAVIYEDVEIPCSEGAWKKAKKDIDSFCERKLSDKQIKKMAKQNLTLDQVSKKIKTLNDATSYLNASGYVQGDGAIPEVYKGDTDWGFVFSSDFTFEHMKGSCGGSSNIFSRLARGDYDEQGYVETQQLEGGHVFCYFKHNGLYYFCDFANPRGADWDGHSKPIPTGLHYYIHYISDNTDDFGKYYIENNKIESQDDPGFQIAVLYMYERNEGDKLPKGYEKENFVALRLPAEIEKTVKVLYCMDGYSYTFEDAPKELPGEENLTIE